MKSTFDAPDVCTNFCQVTDRVDSLFSLIESIQGSEISVFRERTAQSRMGQSSTSWSDLRHYAGRVVSYSHGVRKMLIAAELFPGLFDDPEVVYVRSSTVSDNPLLMIATSEDAAILGKTTSDETATASILRQMTADSTIDRKYPSLLEEARGLNLEDTIQTKSREKTFRPQVHAELLVLRSLEKDGLTHPSDFFNSWKYIGSSKSTCRLCDYYFRAHNDGFEVRPTHGNLYINWKPPDLCRAY